MFNTHRTRNNLLDSFWISGPSFFYTFVVDVVYHVTIVAMDKGVEEILAFLVLGCVLRTAGSSFMWNYADPLTSLELLNYYLTLAIY